MNYKMFLKRFRWKNYKVGLKLGIGFGAMIAIFFILGLFALVNMRAIQKKSTYLGTDLIPMAGHTHNLVHFTHEAMHAMLGYALSEEPHYYQLANDNFRRIDQFYLLADSLIEYSQQLEVFTQSSKSIRQKIDEFKERAGEMEMVNTHIVQLRHNMDSTFMEFSRFSRALLIKENQDFRDRLLDPAASVDELVSHHKISKLANVIIDKGNISRIETMKALAQKDHQLIVNVHQQHYRFLFSLIQEARKIADPRATRYLDRIEQSVDFYKTSMFELSEAISRTRLLEKEIEEVAFSALVQAHRISTESNKITTRISSQTISLLEASTRFLIIGLLLSFLLALFFAFRITRAITIPVSKSVGFAQKVASGNLNAQMDVNQKDEVGILAKALEGMLHNLRNNIHARKQAEQRMLTSILETEQKERKRFAEDLHDGLGPLLSTIKLYINSFESPKYDQAQRAQMLANANEVINEAILNTKRIANNLMPVLLNDFGLKVAVQSFCQNLQSTNAINIQCNCALSDQRLDQNTETMLFNTIMELTNNTIKHASATLIRIRMSQNDKGLNIIYDDDGTGCDIKAVLAGQHTHFGLRNIVSRIQSIDGEIAFMSEIGKGFSVNIHVGNS